MSDSDNIKQLESIILNLQFFKEDINTMELLELTKIVMKINNRLLKV
jgi:hypothetical protein